MREEEPYEPVLRDSPPAVCDEIGSESRGFGLAAWSRGSKFGDVWLPGTGRDRETGRGVDGGAATRLRNRIVGGRLESR